MPLSSTYCAPTGTIVSAEDIFIEGGPEFWIGGVPQNTPDDDGFWWGITGTAADPAYLVGCYENFTFRDNVTVNDIQCDTVGVKSAITKRNYLDITFTLKSLLPLSHLNIFMKGDGVTQNTTEGTEKFGLGEIDSNVYYMTFFSRVYNDEGDCFTFTGHRCQVVDAFELATVWGQPWTLTGFVVRCFADDSKPDGQLFGTIVRIDPSELS